MTAQITNHGARSILFAASVLLLAGIFTTAAVADDTNPPATPAATEQAERCITIRAIRQTKVVDDRTIIFYTTNNRNYKNRLPHSCSGLAMADSFSYSTSQSQLCSVDIITVLNRMGSDLAPGPSCGLGMFEPIDQRQLDELTKKPK